MKYTGYIVLKYYDKDTQPINTEKRLFETIFLKPEYNIEQEDKTNKPSVLPIYTSQSEAEGDAEWWPGHTYEDYGVVRKVTIEIKEEVFNTIKDEKKRLKDYSFKEPNNSYYKEELNQLSWYQE
jgi:hypothetical protein